jgi:hypothetical protein
LECRHRRDSCKCCVLGRSIRSRHSKAADWHPLLQHTSRNATKATVRTTRTPAQKQLTQPLGQVFCSPHQCRCHTLPAHCCGHTNIGQVGSPQCLAHLHKCGSSNIMCTRLSHCRPLSASGAEQEPTHVLSHTPHKQCAIWKAAQPWSALTASTAWLYFDASTARGGLSRLSSACTRCWRTTVDEGHVSMLLAGLWCPLLFIQYDYGVLTRSVIHQSSTSHPSVFQKLNRLTVGNRPTRSSAGNTAP